MPRGFLVKRYGPASCDPPRCYSDEDRTEDSSSDEVPPIPEGKASPQLYRPSSSTPPHHPTLTPAHSNSPSSLQGKKRIFDVCNVPAVSSPAKKLKATRRLNFDEDKSSPVSGTFIIDDEDTTVVRSGDIDPALNVVVVTEEARAELAKIENKIGDYVCRLCRERHADAFRLAQHRCSRIAHVEYRCPECDKLFNCPANLASHRRWHKPRPAPSTTVTQTPLAVQIKQTPTIHAPSTDTRDTSSPESLEEQFECETCGKRFRRRAYLRKHRLTHQSPVMVTSTMSPEEYECQCGKVYRSAAERARHILMDHLGGGPSGPLSPSEVFPCPYCASSFFTAPGLGRHLAKCHGSETPTTSALLLMPRTLTA